MHGTGGFIHLEGSLVSSVHARGHCLADFLLLVPSLLALVSGKDLRYGGDTVCVHLRPGLGHSSEGDISYASRSGYGDTSILGLLGLDLVSTADLPGPGPSDVPLLLHYINVEVIYNHGLDGRAKFAAPDSSPADCSIWDLHLHQPRDLGWWWCHHQGLLADVSSPQWNIFFSSDWMFIFSTFLYIALGTLKSQGQASKFSF